MKKQELSQKLKRIITFETFDKTTSKLFQDRIELGNLTREEDPGSHFCVYFSAYDSKHREVFLGHHKKARIWLFNGGHIEQNEFPKDTLIRETREEWGVEIDIPKKIKPDLLTVTNIVYNPVKRSCKVHFDIWYFISLDKNLFHPDSNKLEEEFYEADWLTISQAQSRVVDKNTKLALLFIRNKLLSS